MKVRITNHRPKWGIISLEALLAGVILTFSTAYAATICPMYWRQMQLEADLQNRLVIQAAVDHLHDEMGTWPENLADLAGCEVFQGNGLPSNPLTGRPYQLDPDTHRPQ